MYFTEIGNFLLYQSFSTLQIKLCFINFYVHPLEIIKLIYISTYLGSPVGPDLANIRHFGQIFKSFRQFSKPSYSIMHKMGPTLANF